MKNFNDYLKENDEWWTNFKEAGKSNAKSLGIEQSEWLYESMVKDHWIIILNEENSISEKDYRNYEKIEGKLENFIKEHNDTYKTIVMEFEKQGSRYQYCAKHLNAIYPIKF